MTSHPTPAEPADEPNGVRAPGGATERRRIEVRMPHLSRRANARLTDEVQAVIGTDRVTVTTDRPHPSRGEDMPHGHTPAAGTSTNFVVAITALVLLVVGVLLTALTGSWWFTALALVADALGGAFVIAMVVQMTGVREHAESSTVALLEEEGVRSPDVLLSELVAEFTETDREATGGDEQRETAVEDDPLKAGAEQAAAGTPTGGRSTAVGPGSDS